jgi:hypothetical protein
LYSIYTAGGPSCKGTFPVDFGSRSLPTAAYPVIDETIPLSLEDFVLSGKTTSTDSFCGGIEGYVQVRSNAHHGTYTPRTDEFVSLR